MSKRTELIADILMGAAFADKRLDGREYAAVKQILAETLGAETIPAELEDRLKAFEHTTFDPADAVRSLELADKDEGRKLVELVAAVHDADDELDLDEDAYLRSVAEAAGLTPDDIADLSLEIISVESASDLLAEPPSTPDAD